MPRPLRWFTGVFILLFHVLTYGQEIEVSDPRVEMRGNIIHVSYDIYNSTPAEEYTVDLRVTDSDGNVVPARALTGDVGEKVKGGGEKHIAWDLLQDKIIMNAEISFQVHVKAVPPPEPVFVPPPVVKEEEKQEEVQKDQLQAEDPANQAASQAVDKTAENPDEELQDQILTDAEQKKPEPEKEIPEEKVDAIEGGKQFNRGGLMLQSALFPGLGLARYKGGPHWIKGVAGYGCLAGSVVLNRMAMDNYNSIETLADYETKNDLYHKLVRQDNFSEVFAYAAIVIWVSDLAWTFIGTTDINLSTSHDKGIRINSAIDPISRAPLIAFTYKF